LLGQLILEPENEEDLVRERRADPEVPVWIAHRFGDGYDPFVQLIELTETLSKHPACATVGYIN
jgi:hypothetical protein